MQDKNTTLSVLKGLAMMLVIYGHVLQRVMVLSGEDFFNHPVFKIIYTFHMPLFVFISGYLIAGSLSRKSPPEVLQARGRGLLLPYLTWGTLGVLSFYVLAMLDGNAVKIHFVRDWIEQMIIDPEIWFLVTLLACAGLLVLSVTLQKYWGLAAFAAVYFLLLLIPYNEYGALYYIKWFYLFYAAGYFVKQYGGAVVQRLNRKAVVAAGLILFICLIPYWTKNDYIYVNKMAFLTADYFSEIFRFVYRYFVSFLGIALVFYLGSYLAKTPTARFWETIGDYSLAVYLLQRYLVEGLFPILWSRTGIEFDAHSPVFLFVFAPVVALLAVGLCIAIAKGVLKRNPLINMLFLGQRS